MRGILMLFELIFQFEAFHNKKLEKKRSWIFLC